MPCGDEQAGDVEKAAVDHKEAIPTDGEPPKVAQPGKGPFYFPTATIAPQGTTVGGFAFSVAAVRRNQLCAPGQQSPPQVVAIVGLVGDNARQLGRAQAAVGAGQEYFFERRLQQRYFRRRGRRQECSERNTFTVHQYHPLRSLAALGLADFRAPFFAGAKLPSAKASSHFSRPFRSRSESSCRHAASQTPASSHSFSRRQQVTPLGYSDGISRHRAPVRSTHKMPSKQLRLFLQGRPLPSRRRGSVGSSGSIRAHWSSVSPDRLAIVGLEFPELLHSLLRLARPQAPFTRRTYL